PLALSAGLLLALPALGAYWQYKLTEDAWKIIEDHIARKAGGYVPPLPGRCGTCGAANNGGSTYCSSCGANLRVGLICAACGAVQKDPGARRADETDARSEEHTSELQSLRHLVCRLLLEK